MNPFDPFDILDQLHDVEWTPELEAAEQEMQADSIGSRQMLARVLILAAIVTLIVLACWLGWRY